MQTIKDWYLGGMVPAQDDAEFEKKHPRKGGKFAKKGEGGSSVSMSDLNTAYNDFYYNNGASPLKDAAITPLSAKFDELMKTNPAFKSAHEAYSKFRGENALNTYGKMVPRFKAAFVSAYEKVHGEPSSFKGTTAELLNKTVAGLTDAQIENGIKNGELALKKKGLTDEQRVKYKHGLDALKTEKANRAKKAEDGKGGDGFAKGLKDKIATMPKLSDGVKVGLAKEKDGTPRIVATFKREISNEDTEKIAEHLGADLVQQEYERGGWVVFSAYPKGSVPSFIKKTGYFSEEDIALGQKDNEKISKVDGLSAKEAVDYYKSCGRGAEVDGEGVKTWFENDDGTKFGERHYSVADVTDEMHSHMIRNAMYGMESIGKFDIPDRWKSAIGESSLFKKYAK